MAFLGFVDVIVFSKGVGEISFFVDCSFVRGRIVRVGDGSE